MKRKPKQALRAGLPVVRIVDAPVPPYGDPAYARWVDAAIFRMGEIELMAGIKVTNRQAASLMLEHFMLSQAVSHNEVRRLNEKAAEMRRTQACL